MDTATPDVRRFDNHIRGERVPPAEGRRFVSVNPTTGKAWGEFAEAVAPVLARSQQFIGSAPFDEESVEDVVDRLIAIDPTLDGTTTFVPEDAPVVEDVMTFFRQNA